MGDDAVSYIEMIQTDLARCKNGLEVDIDDRPTKHKGEENESNR